MNNFTPEDLSHLQPSGGARHLADATRLSQSTAEESLHNLQELNIPEEEARYLQQSAELLKELRFSPRKATIDAIMQYARQNEEAVH